MKHFSHLNSAVQILQDYGGKQPFAVFVKEFFGKHKKFGSRDRKGIAHLCYCYFRLGNALDTLAMEEKALLGLFLCSSSPNEYLDKLKPEWNKLTDLTAEEKISQSGYDFSPVEIFPAVSELTASIDKNDFLLSHFIQPELFLRVRPGKLEQVQQKLNEAAIPFEKISPVCLALPNASKIEEVVKIDMEVVIQDMSSQKTGELMQLAIDAQKITTAWDCCAASGGKSILLHDTDPQIDLTVSDIRESIIANLRKRFSRAGISHYNSFVADLSKGSKQPAFNSNVPGFDLILADVPCTGSGTWGRTPEQLKYFDTNLIDDYANRQRNIASTALYYLKPGGFFLYITCSVYQKENEAIVDYLLKQFNLQFVIGGLLKGYDQKADTLFAALLKKPL